MRFLVWPILVLAFISSGNAQSVEQLLAQAKATETIESLLADAVVEESPILINFVEKTPNFQQNSRRPVPIAPAAPVSVTTETPEGASGARRLLFRPRASRPTFFNRVRSNILSRTTTTTPIPEPVNVSSEEDEIVDEQPPVTRVPFGGRVSLFSSPRQRFR